MWFIALDVASTSAAMYIVDCVVLALPSEPVKTNLTVCAASSGEAAASSSSVTTDWERRAMDELDEKY